MTADSSFELALSPPPRRVKSSVLWGAFILWALLALFLGATQLGPVLFPDAWAQPAGAVLGALLAAASASLAWPRFRPPEALEPLVLHEDGLTLPRSVYRAEMARLDLREIFHIGVSPGASGFLEVLSSRRQFRIPLRCIRDRARLKDLGTAFGEALRHLEGGPEHLARIEAGDRFAGELLERSPYATRTLLIIMAGFCLLLWRIGVFGPDIYAATQGSLRLGANAPVLVGSEPWRLLTATFLHGSFLHAYINGIVLFAGGTVLERLLGTARFAAVFLWSALAGATVSSWTSAHFYTVGASAGVFGVFGALVILYLSRRERVPAGFHQSARWWAFMVSITFLLPVLVPHVEPWGYFLGALTGLLLGLVLGFEPGFRFGAPPGWMAQGLAGSAIGLFSVATLLGAASALRPETSHRADLVQVWLQDDSRSQLATAKQAVTILDDERAPKFLVQAADAWLGTSASQDGTHSAVLLARSERLEARGSLPAAVELRWKALNARGAGAFPALASGLLQLDPKPLALRPAYVSSVGVRRMVGDDRVTLVLDPPVSVHSTLLLLTMDAEEELRGVFEWPMEPGSHQPQTTLPEELTRLLEAGGQFVPALWATPPTASEPTFYPLTPDNAQDWRRHVRQSLEQAVQGS